MDHHGHTAEPPCPGFGHQPTLPLPVTRGVLWLWGQEQEGARGSGIALSWLQGHSRRWEPPAAPADSRLAQCAQPCFINILCLPGCKIPTRGEEEEEEEEGEPLPLPLQPGELCDGQHSGLPSSFLPAASVTMGEEGVS